MWPTWLLRAPCVFLWVTPTVLRGWRHRLQQNDATAMSSWTSATTDSLLAWYDGAPGGYRRRLWLLVRWRLLGSGVLYALYCATQLLQPVLLRRIVLAVEQGRPDGAWYAVAIGVAGVLGSLAKEQQLFINYTLGSELRSLTVALVYRTALTLREAEAPPTLANLLTNDAQKLLDALPLIHLFWATPCMILIAAIMLVDLAGWAALSGMALLLCLVPANLWLVGQLKAARAAHLPRSDARVARCVELVRSARALKFNGWDQAFEDGILSLRKSELPYIRTELRLFSYLMTMTVALPQLATALALAAAVLARPDLPLTAALAFPALSLFSVTRFPIMFFGELSGQLAQASVALRRLTRFLDGGAAGRGAEERGGEGGGAGGGGLAGESRQGRLVGVEGVQLSEWEGVEAPLRRVVAQNDLLLKAGVPSLGSAYPTAVDGRPLLVLEDASFAWGGGQGAGGQRNQQGKAQSEPGCGGGGGDGGGGGGGGRGSGASAFAVSGVTFSVYPGDLLMVVGAVGAGKSSLLSGVLGEARLTSGRVDTSGAGDRVAYCSQSAWVQNMSVRDNIVFGKDFEEEWYNSVVAGCALQTDLADLPHGDGTIVGERGVTLSGGQKQRVALARAVYSRPSLVLLDDVFSALDGPTGRLVFSALFDETAGLLRGAGTVLVGHATHFAPRATAGCVLLQAGRQAARGSLVRLKAELEEIDAAGGGGYTVGGGGGTAAAGGGGAACASRPPHPPSLHPSDAEPLRAFLDSIGGGEEDTEGEHPQPPSAQANPSSRLKATGGAADDFAREGAGADPRLGLRTLLAWVAAAGGGCWFGVELAFFACERLSYVGADYWLSAWTSAAPDAIAAASAAGPSRNSNAQALGELLGFGPAEDAAETRRYLLVYFLLAVANAVFALLRTFWFVRGGWRAARVVFERLLHAVARSPMSFFDTTPVGRVTARLAYDTEIVDGLLVQKGLTVMASFFWLVSGLCVVLSVVPIAAVAMLPCALVYSAVHVLYVKAGVQMQRLYAQSVSPLVSHIEESLAGGSTVRAFHAPPRFRSRLSSLNDDAAQAFTSFIAVGRWLAVRLETIGALVSFAVTMACWALSDSLSGPLAGLAVIWSFNLTITLNFLVLSTSELEAKGVSLERVLEYAALPPEADRFVPSSDDDLRKAGWPAKGELRFEQVTLRYRPSLPPALDGFSCVIAPGEHVGVVGRTGAGKSTLAAALFRLVELEAGRVTLDGVDLRPLGLHLVRGSRALAIVNQDPTLFRGAVRRSVDPLGAHSDDELWAALAAVGLRETVLSLQGGLDALVEEGGANWSVGERQLLCFARATLRAPSVLLLDEATASIDHAADARIQRTLRSAMAHVTLLTIAHRLHTVVDYNRILVMHAGRCAEAGRPHELLCRKGSALSALVDAVGGATALRLRAIAAEAHAARAGAGTP